MKEAWLNGEFLFLDVCKLIATQDCWVRLLGQFRWLWGESQPTPGPCRGRVYGPGSTTELSTWYPAASLWVSGFAFLTYPYFASQMQVHGVVFAASIR